MSIEGKAVAEGGTPAYVIRFDGVRVLATDYHPVWLDSLADDVTIEGSAMNGPAPPSESSMNARHCAFLILSIFLTGASRAGPEPESADITPRTERAKENARRAA